MNRITLGNGGWIHYESAERSIDCYVRFKDIAGRLEPDELYVTGGVTSDGLRRFPLKEIHAWMLEHEAELRYNLGAPCPDLATAISYFSSSIGTNSGGHWAADMLLSQDTSSGLRRSPMRRQSQRLPLDRDLPRPAPVDATIAVPSTKPYPDEFFERLATLYRKLVAAKEHPAPYIAHHNDVSKRTVHGWVAEARKRGFLPQAHQGRAG